MESGELRDALRGVKRRIRRNRAVRGAAFGTAAGAAGGAALLLLSRAVIIPDAKIWAGIAFMAAVILCAAGNALRKVTDREAAVQLILPAEEAERARAMLVNAGGRHVRLY